MNPTTKISSRVLAGAGAVLLLAGCAQDTEEPEETPAAADAAAEESPEASPEPEGPATVPVPEDGDVAWLVPDEGELDDWIVNVEGRLAVFTHSAGGTAAGCGSTFGLVEGRAADRRDAGADAAVSAMDWVSVAMAGFSIVEEGSETEDDAEYEDLGTVEVAADSGTVEFAMVQGHSDTMSTSDARAGVFWAGDDELYFSQSCMMGDWESGEQALLELLDQVSVTGV